MFGTAEQHVFVLDDEPTVREILRRLLQKSGMKVTCFSDAATCLASLRCRSCNLLITDLKMPETDGIELLTEVRHLAPWVPVLLISGYGDIPTAVNAMKAGAVDFIEKPLDKTALIRTVRSILQRTSCFDPGIDNPLTQAETRVLSYVIDGKSSKEIARLLHRSTRTIEGHRSHLMRKLRAQGLLDLAKRAALMGLVDMRARPELARLAKTL